MAELLIIAQNNTHPDPVIDAMFCFKLCDIVHVVDDGHEWGAKECLPDFYIVRIPGVPASSVWAARTDNQQTPSEFMPSAIKAIPRLSKGYQTGVTPKQLSVRRYFIPSTLLQAADEKGVVTLNLSDIKDKRHVA